MACIPLIMEVSLNEFGLQRPVGGHNDGNRQVLTPAKSGVMAARSATLRPARAAQKAPKAHSPLSRLSLSLLASSHFDDRFPWVDGRFPWVSRRRTNTWRPRGRALSKSRTASLPGGSAAQPKLMESTKDHARSPQTAASPAVLPQSARRGPQPCGVPGRASAEQRDLRRPAG